jgi:hypothetical protein
MSWLLPGVLLLFGAGCSSSRIVNAEYGEVAPALRERFARDEWTKKSTAKSAVKEKAGRTLSITYYEWEYPDVKILCDMTATARRDGKTKVSVFVRDYDSWWSPFRHRPKWAHGVLDALESRLRQGSWRGMPWGGSAIDPNPPRTWDPPPAGNEDGSEPLLIPVD